MCGFKYDDGKVEPIINDSGVYRSICVEIDIYGLAVCAIMSSGDLDAEGLTSLAVSTTSDGKNKPDLTSGSQSSDASCARAFRLLFYHQ